MNQINNYWKNKLYNTCDGAGLRNASKCPSAHNWVSDGTAFLSGRDYIKSIHLRYGCLFNKARCARGRSDKCKECRRGCERPETLNHILQNCYSTHFLRIKRHNSLVQYLNRTLTSRNNTVHVEPIFTVDNNKLKPDLVIYNFERVVLVDVQIINDQFPLQTAHLNKIKKYEVLKSQLQDLRPGGLFCTTLTVNWRGVIAERSFRDLMALGLLRRGDFRVLASRAVLGGVISHNAFQRMTVRDPHKMKESA